MNLSITVDSKALQAAFNRAPGKVVSGLNSWVSRTALRTEREAKMQVPPRIDTGQTQNSITTLKGRLSATVRPTAKHAIFVHEGRRAGKMPPYQAGTHLNAWAKRRGIPPFLVARAIGRKGTKPHKFMDKAYRIVKPSAERDAERTLDRIVRSI